MDKIQTYTGQNVKLALKIKELQYVLLGGTKLNNLSYVLAQDEFSTYYMSYDIKEEKEGQAVFNWFKDLLNDSFIFIDNPFFKLLIKNDSISALNYNVTEQVEYIDDINKSSWNKEILEITLKQSYVELYPRHREQNLNLSEVYDKLLEEWSQRDD